MNRNLVLAMALFLASPPAWAAKAKVSVLAFENKAANSENGQDCHGWNWLIAQATLKLHTIILAESGE